MAEEYVFFNRKNHTSEDIYGSSQLDQDTTHYFPWVYNMATHSLRGQWWGLHLLEEWQELPHLHAPPEYENEYNLLRGQERADWLVALRRVCTGAFKEIILQDFDGEEEHYPLSNTSQHIYNGLKEDLFRAINRSLRKLDAWLSWREQSPSEQLLTALSVLHLYAKDGSLVVPYSAPEIERGYFKALLEAFRLRLVAEPPAESWLRILHSQLSALGKIQIPEAPVSVKELSLVFPSVQWLNLSEFPGLPVSPGFWLDLKTTLTTRIEWANRAVALMEEALGISALPVQDLDAPSAKLSLKQAAMLYYYTDQPLTDNNRSELAARLGHTGKTSGARLMEKYAEWCEQVAGNLKESPRRLKYIREDLVSILPHLPDKSANKAVNLLNKLAKKFIGGL